eukprot:Protomagalhaensia_wolfi_Nauph_80__3719@NODE_375_length_2653_cov_94_590666_g283_i0_p4_GENE_NODE_375_length_2653_cov_94_590666_g283_i0NODE_375_length_2653_cov_94_590666_g283_i0_p4_ORF_typecomplete_len133_score37_12Prefoldin_2/PF01920_20/3_9e05Vir_act_alpha_C/PF10400_9/7_6e02Vir_act_alpha_C/PF10400_9/0_06_NODE_375_length_2653_cov_94_590666_g283_i021342532
MQPVTVSGPEAEAFLQARSAFQITHEQLIKTKKKSIEALHEQKRAEAALEELSATRPRAFQQVGRGFVLVPTDSLISSLEEQVQKNKAQRDQLAELEKVLVQRSDQQKARMTVLQGEIEREVALRRNAVQQS